jgi:hypothetical protein
MPHRSRIDTPGALHHVIYRWEDIDYVLQRFGSTLSKARRHYNIATRSRRKQAVTARSLMCFGAFRELGMSHALAPKRGAARWPSVSTLARSSSV